MSVDAALKAMKGKNQSLPLYIKNPFVKNLSIILTI
jgi:hypothetical protein